LICRFKSIIQALCIRLDTGSQPIYQFHAQVVIDGKPAGEADAKAGLRSVVLRRDQDQWGRSFEFVVNGIPSLRKEADVIPFDSFPSRVATVQQRILQSAKRCQYEYDRLWAAVIYESQQFYDLCDELGLMVWQSSCSAISKPGIYGFKQQVERETEYQIERLRNHSSIVLWSGNNEIGDGDGSQLGWTRQPTSGSAPSLWQDYLTEFSGILARSAARLDPETPYWPSSPSADYDEV